MKKYLIAILLTNYFLTTAQDQNSLVAKKQDLTEEQLKTWYFLDYTEDTIPGISLDKAYRDLIKEKKGQEVIVAVLDTKLDIHHEDLKGQIWINTDEIPDNLSTSRQGHGSTVLLKSVDESTAPPRAITRPRPGPPVSSDRDHR